MRGAAGVLRGTTPFAPGICACAGRCSEPPEYVVSQGAEGPPRVQGVLVNPTMNSSLARVSVRNSTVAALLAGAALLLGACSTAPIAREPSERAVSYAQLHGLMVKIAYEGDRIPVATTAAPTDLGGSGTFATNP